MSGNDSPPEKKIDPTIQKIYAVIATAILLAKTISLFILQFRKDRGKKIAIGFITGINLIIVMMAISLIITQYAEEKNIQL